MTGNTMDGVMDKAYHTARLKRRDFKYRLLRRTEEVMKIIEQNFDNYSQLSCLDIGTSDGLMLSRLNQYFKFKNAYGIDLSRELLACNKDKKLKLSTMNAEDLRFKDSSIDIVIATAVIEHCNNVNKMLGGCLRVLKKGGIIVITAPNPFADKIASLLHYGFPENHMDLLDIKIIKKHLNKAGFRVISSKYFMFFPFFKIILEEQIEKVMRAFGLGTLMTNQLIVGKKKTK